MKKVQLNEGESIDAYIVLSLEEIEEMLKVVKKKSRKCYNGKVVPQMTLVIDSEVNMLCGKHQIDSVKFMKSVHKN